MRIKLSCRTSHALLAASAATALAFTGMASAAPLPIDPVAIAESIRTPATKTAYNAAQDNLVTGKYDVGLAALNALALIAPNDANIPALQAFYNNASGDEDATDAALTRLATVDPTLHRSVADALTAITYAAESPVDYAPTLDAPRTAVVVLGFGLTPDGGMRPELIDRLEAGKTAADASPQSPVVVTGGNPQNGVAEADAMRDWLIDNGIAADRVHAETEANSTVQNALFTTKMLPALGVDSVVLSTSDNHIRRAISDFLVAGTDVIGAAAKDPANPPDIATLGPTSRLGMTVDATKVIGIPRTY